MTAPARHHRLSPWGRLVAVSAVLVVGFAGTLIVWNVLSRQERVLRYGVRGMVEGVSLDLGDGDLEIRRAGPRAGLAVEREDHYAFGRDAKTTREVSGGVFRVRSRCPKTVLHSCAVRYRLLVPDNVPVDVRTDDGTVRFDGYRGSARVTTRGGDIRVRGFCGFSLQARAESGDIDASSSCAPPQLSLRSTSGSVHASVPAGRYQVEAESASGHRSVRGIMASGEAPFSVQALSSSGDVRVEGRP